MGAGHETSATAVQLRSRCGLDVEVHSWATIVDTVLMLLQYLFSSENTPVTELFGNGTVSGQIIFVYYH